MIMDIPGILDTSPVVRPCLSFGLNCPTPVRSHRIITQFTQFHGLYKHQFLDWNDLPIRSWRGSKILSLSPGYHIEGKCPISCQFPLIGDFACSVSLRDLSAISFILSFARLSISAFFSVSLIIRSLISFSLSGMGMGQGHELVSRWPELRRGALGGSTVRSPLPAD